MISLIIFSHLYNHDSVCRTMSMTHVDAAMSGRPRPERHAERRVREPAFPA